jgi:hypothetical protein
MNNRRKFIKQMVLLFGASAMSNWACQPNNKYAHIKGKILTGNNKRGHLLREGKFTKPTQTNYFDVVIVGSGIAALSAARKLQQNNITNFTILELDDTIGGNAINGKNEVSAYPWAAHYLPIPNLDDKELLNFLQEHQIITKIDEKGIPNYNEEYVCAEPEERLFINGYWQDGLIPNIGISSEEKKEIDAFFALIKTYKSAIGNDGKPAFTIPNFYSTTDSAYTDLDNISFYDFLKQKGFKTKALFWYLNYCVSDDYGTNLNDASAWSGIHYFAARKGVSGNTEGDTVLTWPEGNAFLAQKLASTLQTHIQKNKLVFEIIPNQQQVEVNYHCFEANTTKQIIAKKVIVCAPQFVNKRIVKNYPEIKNSPFTYSPWMVANLTVNAYTEGTEGQPMSWDNVIFGSNSLGYVNASHQLLQTQKPQQVFTFYLPLNSKTPKEAREEAYEKTYEQWLDIIFEELKQAHPSLVNHVTKIDIKVWGHSMIRPTVGLRKHLKNPIFNEGKNQNIFFAHSDLSGISIFEEAFFQGNKAASQVIKTLANA